MKYLIVIFIILSCSSLRVDPKLVMMLHQNQLIGHWSDEQGSYVKIFCEGQFAYERDYKVNSDPTTTESHQHFLGFHDSDKNGRIESLSNGVIKIIPFAKKYRINKMPHLRDGKLSLEFEGKVYQLKEKFECHFSR